MTAAAEAPSVVPGVYDIPADQYHRDPVPGGSLSSTGARKLLAPSCPAIYHYELGHPQQPKKHFDLGTAVHTLVLGEGPRPVAVDADNYKTKKAQQDAADARARGAIPVLPHEMQQVQDMAAALLNHPQAGPLLTAGSGEVEQTLIWRDEETGVWCRARPDRFDDHHVIDVKTTNDPNPAAIQKAIYEHGYHQQQGHYLDGIQAITNIRPEFTFLFVGKTPPYLVSVVQLDIAAALIGDARNRRARHIYAHCQATDTWPGYGDDTHVLALPQWAETRETEEYL